MKIAVASEGNRVSAHFGHCPEYTVFSTEGDKIVGKSIVTNPGHQPGFLPGYLAQHGINCIIAGGMGPNAQQLFAQHNIKTVTGVSGSVEKVIDAFLANQLESRDNLCNHESDEHQSCQHG